MKYHRLSKILIFAVFCAAVAPAKLGATTYRMNVKTVPEAGNKCVSAPDGPLVEGMRVFIWDCNAALAQTLTFDDQSQQLKFGANCVQVLGPGAAQDAISVGTCNGSANQRWGMIANNDIYQIVGMNGLCLDVSNGVVANGTPLDLSKCGQNTLAQRWVLFQAADAAPGQSTPGQPANPVQALLERHNLIGTFGEDCSKDPSDSNQYIMHRLVGADRVERDQMKGRNLRSYAAFVTDAEELTPNDIAMSIQITEAPNAQMKDSRMRLVTRLDGSRIRLMESSALSGPFAGQTNIFGGKATNGGTETHWLTKCP
jgi:hypothetical protein